MVNLLPVSFANVSIQNRKYAIECDLRNCCKSNVLNCVRVLSSIARVHPPTQRPRYSVCVFSWHRIRLAPSTQNMNKK